MKYIETGVASFGCAAAAVVGFVCVSPRFSTILISVALSPAFGNERNSFFGRSPPAVRPLVARPEAPRNAATAGPRRKNSAFTDCADVNWNLSSNSLEVKRRPSRRRRNQLVFFFVSRLLIRFYFHVNEKKE